MEYNLVEIWLRKDPVRWIAGGLAGLFAGTVAIGVAMMISSSHGLEPWFPIKLAGTILLGPNSTDIMSTKGITAGGSLLGGLFLVLGIAYAHFTGTNFLGALLPMGLVWGIFSWIFIWNLFSQSWQPIFAARIPSGPMFLICIVFGLSLASVAFFDRVLRGGRDRS